MPYAGIDDSRLALMQNARLLVALDGQLALEHGEALDKGGMPVFPHDTRPNESGQLGARLALALRVSTSQLTDCPSSAQNGRQAFKSQNKGT